MAEEMKVYALPVSWPQPEYAIGEQVYREGYDEPVTVQGLYYAFGGDECSYDCEGPHWLYEAGYWRWHVDELSREPWPKPAPVVYPRSEPGDPGYDPFLDENDLP